LDQLNETYVFQKSVNEVMFQLKVFRDNLRDKKRLAKQAKSLIEQRAKLKGVELIYRREKA